MVEQAESLFSKNFGKEIDISSLDIESFIECFRFLRNNCTEVNFQSTVGSHESLLRNCISFLHILRCNFKVLNERQILCFLLGLQFLGNMTVGHEKNQNLLWSHLLFFKEVYSIPDIKCRNSVSMAVYNMILGAPERGSEIVSNCEVMKMIISDAIEESDFSTYLLESLLKAGYFGNLYEISTSKEKLFILELVESGNIVLPSNTLMFIANLFKKNSDKILKTVSDYAEAIDPTEFVKLVTVLGKVTSTSVELNCDRSLLINFCYLLLAIHKAGKENETLFTPLKELVGNWDEINDHPAFGLKAQLIRCIGNLVCGSRTNQDLVRELDCIPLVLDCCNIDAKNPLIMQWAIVCIRYLVEGNSENQDVVRRIEHLSNEAQRLFV